MLSILRLIKSLFQSVLDILPMLTSYFIALFKPLISLEESKEENQISTIEGQCPGTSSQASVHATTDIKTTPRETSTAKFTSKWLRYLRPKQYIL